MNGITHRTLLVAFTGALVALASGADDERSPVARLNSEEKFFIHATGLLVMDPKNEDGLDAKAKACAKGDGIKWAAKDDVVRSALVSIEKDPILRKNYVASLEKKLDGKPEENRQKLLKVIEKDYTPEKVEKYRVVIEKAGNQNLAAGSLPWPLCIPLKCCK